MCKIYESLKIEVEGGQYAKSTMIAKLDYAWSINKITEEQHIELTALVETCADPNYAPVKNIEERFAELEVELLNNQLCVAELSAMYFDVDDRLFAIEEKLDSEGVAK